MVVDQKLKGLLSARDKRSSHGLNCSLAMEEKRIDDLEILAHHLQKGLGHYEDHMFVENLLEDIGEYKIKDEKYDFDEEALQPSQLQGFLEGKKATGMYAQDTDYHGRYDGYYHNDD